jgi:hypothetical protein
MKKILPTSFITCCVAALWGQSITPVDSVFQNGKPIVINYTGGTGSPTDWIGIYPPNEVPDGDPPSIRWDYIKTKEGQITFAGTLPNGNYKVHLFCCDDYKILASASFKITGAVPAKIETTQFAKADSAFALKYSGGTGSPKDWIGIYKPTDVPKTDVSTKFEYVPAPAGTLTFAKPGLPAGKYVARLFCCDGYDVLATTEFTVFANLAPSVAPAGTLQVDKSSTFKFTGGTGSFVDWVGIYPKDTIPDGTPPSVSYLYVNGVNGEVVFPPNTFKAGVLYDAHLFCCDDYKILASYKNFSFSTVGTREEDERADLFTASPSPAREVVRLAFSEPLEGQFTFYNIAGQAVRNLPVNGEGVLEVRDLSPGAYIARFEGKQGAQSRRILVE